MFRRSYDHGEFTGLAVASSVAREIALVEGLRLLASKFGVEFKEPLYINSTGEFSLVTEDGKPYGEELAAILTKHKARTGYPGPNMLTDTANWCMMNHFDVAAMLEEQAANENRADSIKQLFDKHANEFEKFERVENPLHHRPDLCAFLLLDSISRSDSNIIDGLGIINIDMNDFINKATEGDIITLIRCGVEYLDDFLVI